MDVLERCKGCANKCKVEVHASVMENAVLVSCPEGKKYKKK